MLQTILVKAIEYQELHWPSCWPCSKFVQLRNQGFQGYFLEAPEIRTAKVATIAAGRRNAQFI